MLYKLSTQLGEQKKAATIVTASSVNGYSLALVKEKR
jgi:hypothetical protein